MDNPSNQGMPPQQSQQPQPQQPQQYYQQPYPQQQQQQYPSYQQPTVPGAPAPSQAQFSAQAQNPAQYGVRVVDSLSTNEFHVEINGQIVTGVFSVSGLTPFRLSVDEAGRPVKVEQASLVVTKMVQQDPNLPFNSWVREAVRAQGKVLPTREIAIVAMDEGVETRRWVFQNAWISEVLFSDFDTALEYLVEERITIRHSGVVELWPGESR